MPPIDLGIFDEAHKTTGSAGGMFAYALADKNIRIKKRLFLTATPRHFDIRHRDRNGEFRVQSMDDESVYGPRAHSLSFAAAANKGIICKYKVLISIIDKKMVDDFTLKNGITLVKKDEIGARWVANLIALQQAAKKVGAKKIISFHSRVNLAHEFASNEPRGIAFHLSDFKVGHVNGTQSSGEREELIGTFSRAPKAILTNARCLTEGINIPAVDMVAFIDPRQSKVDIVQAVGRAMRKPRGPTTKTVGYILVPLFAEMDAEGIDEAIESEKFEAVADVLNALQEHDEELVDIIREIKQRKGEDERFDPKRLLEKVEFIGPAVSFDLLTKSIGIAIADSIGSSWDEWYGQLSKFVKREGHCRVPKLRLENGDRLGQWVGVQRSSVDQLSEDRRQRLDRLGFVWNALEEQWEEGFGHLEAFVERNKHGRVPKAHLEEGFRLGQWVAVQRLRANQLSTDRRHRLDALGFVWNTLDDQWEEGFRHLSAFVRREKHCLVPDSYKEDGYRLGSWVARQRANTVRLSPVRRDRLVRLGFVWNTLDDQWEVGFRHLSTFAERERHCRVPQGHLESGYRLGQWVSVQRSRAERLSEVHRQRLNKIKFVWDPYNEQWEEGFRHLAAFFGREKHLRVPAKHIENGYLLGSWVVRIRAGAHDLSPTHRQRLDELKFVWDPLEERWEEGFEYLSAYLSREKHCRVPRGHLESGYKLGDWVRTQRVRQDKLSKDRCQRLEEIGFVWDPLDEQWEYGFRHLSAFVKRENHCRVPAKHIENGFKLGVWVGGQRSKAGELSKLRRERLNKIGFVWKAR